MLEMLTVWLVVGSVLGVIAGDAYFSDDDEADLPPEEDPEGDQGGVNLLLSVGGVAAGSDDAVQDGRETGTGTEGAEGSVIGGSEVDDTLAGGEGDDTIDGGSGNDDLSGLAGADSLVGDGGDDRLSGGEGDDRMLGGLGLDTLWGGAGDDLLDGGIGDDSLEGEAGDDSVFGNFGADLVAGGDGNDMLYSSGLGLADDGEADTLLGGAGDDLLSLGDGDLGEGGEGADTFQYLPQGTAAGGATISDFTPAEDMLVIQYEGDTAPAILSQRVTAGGLDILLDNGDSMFLIGMDAPVDPALVAFVAA